jgi:nicotinamidase-related amidase
MKKSALDIPKRMIKTHETVLVVVDAQRAFVDPAGSLAQTFGAADVRPSVEALSRLRMYLAGRGSGQPTIFVRSEYYPGQFTEGRLDDPMANLCVPGRSIDSEWAIGITISSNDQIATKYQVDAWESKAFRAAIDREVAIGARRILLAGFQFTTCVAASAISTWQAVRGHGVTVAVLENLSGARASSYVPGEAEHSRVESTRRRLTSAGVAVVEETRLSTC